ncbi:MAG: hypothetical protein JW894_12925 [Bacteroidales bacterium]|nr:hypothetical protein [Bacteroidales bacterium]
MKKYSLLIGLLIIILGSCEQVTDYYLGFPQQPEFNDEWTIEGLNIFGIIRPCSSDSLNTSFVFVQQMWPALAYDDLGIITDASVIVYSSSSLDTVEFPLTPPDSNFTDTLYRPIGNFNPAAGEQYIISCQHPRLPEATGSTVFPPAPAIEENSLSIEENSVQFKIIPDTLIKIIDVYQIYGNQSVLLRRLIPDDFRDVTLVFDLVYNPEDSKVVLYGYDANMAIYLGNSNTSLNFNKYRTAFSTLESGYGVFGSMNYSEIELNNPNRVSGF